MRFTKMHGLGNDYLYVFGEVPENIAELSAKLSERHFGAGADGMIYISKSDQADFKMRIFNADGSEGKMCGNGIRCVGKYVYDRGYTDKTELEIETLSGIRHLTLFAEDGHVRKVKVDMGITETGGELQLTDAVGAIRSAMDPENYLFAERTCLPVSVGNPHAVVFVKEIGNVPLNVIGPLFEHHEAFPEGVNTEFVQASGDGVLRMRVWERGSGITMACGTGACASARAAVEKGLCSCGETIKVELDGGTLEIEVEEDGRVFMTGPCEFVYDAVYPAEGAE